ncbi:hypothetical protein H3C70_03480 [Patescibacteria group bacterium]|nr:hypothetical protein [Patescibacteria group bacterium]
MNPTSWKLMALARAVLVTLAYTDQFEFPLLADEVYRRCLSLELERKSFTKKTVDQTLTELDKRGLVERVTTEGKTYFCLHGRSRTVEQRLRKEAAAVVKYQEIQQFLSFARRIPWIQAVYLTGSQAMNSADPHSDIDFMIITQPGRLWLSRILVSFFAQLHGKRRSWNREEPGSWCFNLWLDTTHLAVDVSKRDSYHAYEVLQARPLWAKNDVDAVFYSDNTWINQFFYGVPKAEKHPLTRPTFSGNPLLTFLDWLSWTFQSWYMRRHQTTEKVGRGYAFFHPRDTGKVIAEGWLQSLERCLSKRQALEILQPYVGSPSIATSATNSTDRGREAD